MNCDVVQRLVLGCESPDRPSAAAAAHLADCAACREWLLRLLQMERAVPYLPVPPAEAARSALMRRILSRGTAKKKEPTGEKHRPSIAMVVGSWIMDPHASPRRRVAAGLVAGVAAALLLFITGWLIWDGGQPQPQAGVRPTERAPGDSLLAELRRLKINAAETKSDADRVKVMADAAEELRGRAAARATADDELIDLAGVYGRVVEEGVVKTAEKLSAADRRAILGAIAEDLGRAESEWQRLSQQTGLAPRAKDALTRAALAARSGNARLRELCNS